MTFYKSFLKKELDMDQIEIVKYIGELHLSISEAMRKIDENANGVLFLTDGEGRLKYCISDGDIRRHLLKGGEDGRPCL